MDLINKLKEANDAPLFSLKDEVFNAKCIKCYDGDSITVIFFLNNVLTKWKVRLLGINCKELRSKDKQEKELAVKAKDYLKSKILGKIIRLECDNFDAFGRILGKIYLDDILINNLMISEGYAENFMP
jgi:micrococcal nuclease